MKYEFKTLSLKIIPQLAFHNGLFLLQLRFCNAYCGLQEELKFIYKSPFPNAHYILREVLKSYTNFPSAIPLLQCELRIVKST